LALGGRERVFTYYIYILAGRSLSDGAIASAAGEELHRGIPGGRVS
jgi:hypothetical protein